MLLTKSKIYDINLFEQKRRCKCKNRKKREKCTEYFLNTFRKDKFDVYIETGNVLPLEDHYDYNCLLLFGCRYNYRKIIYYACMHKPECAYKLDFAIEGAVKGNYPYLLDLFAKIRNYSVELHFYKSVKIQNFSLMNFFISQGAGDFYNAIYYTHNLKLRENLKSFLSRIRG